MPTSSTNVQCLYVTGKCKSESYLHKLHDEIYELVLMHVLAMVVCYQKTDIITLKYKQFIHSQQFSHKQLEIWNSAINRKGKHSY